MKNGITVQSSPHVWVRRSYRVSEGDPRENAVMSDGPNRLSVRNGSTYFVVRFDEARELARALTECVDAFESEFALWTKSDGHD